MKNKTLISSIRSVLLNDWDPIRIGDNPSLRDEYDSYISPIINMLIQNQPIEMFVAFLGNIEKNEMGNDNVDIKCLYNVARKFKQTWGSN